MNYKLIRQLSYIENLEELEKKLNQVPLEERGEIAELVACEYNLISNGIYINARNRSDSFGSENSSKICQGAQALINGLIKMFEISHPQSELCLDVALESYKKTHDIQGMKRIGIIKRRESDGYKDLLEEMTEEKRKDEVVYGACAKLTSTGSFLE